jgi:hypothetical protein
MESVAVESVPTPQVPVTEIFDENTGSIAQLNHKGDTKYTWNRKNKAECDAAREHFESLLKKGFLAFKVTRMGCKGSQVGDFNPNSGKYLFTSPMMTREFEPQADYVVTPQYQGG